MRHHSYRKSEVQSRPRSVIDIPHVRDFLSRFPDVVGIGNDKFRASCFCGSKATAEITITCDGSIIYFCRACKAKGAEAAKAMGLPVSTLIPPPPIDYRGAIAARRVRGNQ